VAVDSAREAEETCLDPAGIPTVSGPDRLHFLSREADRETIVGKVNRGGLGCVGLTASDM